MNAPSTAIASRDQGAIIENVIVKGDLSKLTPDERSKYYVEVCKSVGLNPLTKPFEYITLNGKLTLYALRGCTDQLRSIYKVSVVSLEESERDGVFIVTAKMQNGEGRTDMAKGAVTINGLKGDALANSIMKAETKAKRRATLSLCGLGFLDETEIETIPANAKNGGVNPKSSRQAKIRGDWQQFEHELFECESVVRLMALSSEYETNVYPNWKQDWVDAAREAIEKRQADLTAEHLPETLADSIEAETADPPADNAGQDMSFKECQQWLSAASSLADLKGRAENNGYVVALKDLNEAQKSSLRSLYAERVRLFKTSPIEAG